MPISGLVITLDADAGRAAAALDALRAHPCIEVGPMAAPGDAQAASQGDAPRAVGRRMPVVVDAPDRDAGEELWHWLNELPGVVFVDLVCAYDEDGPGPSIHEDSGAGPSCGIEPAK